MFYRNRFVYVLGITCSLLTGCGSTVSTSAGAGGTIEPVSRKVEEKMATATFRIKPDTGYVIDSVEGCEGLLDGEAYITGEIESDCTVKATFLPELNVAFDIKQFHFSWSEVNGSVYYRLFERYDGSTEYTQVGEDISETNISLDIALHKNGWRVNRYRLEACSSSGCVPSYAVDLYDGGVKAIGYIKASNAEPGDHFGQAIALSRDGSTLAVGAPSEDSGSEGIDGEQADNTAKNAGAVYIYHHRGGAWHQQAYVKPSMLTVNGDRVFESGFGTAVALSGDGNTLVVSSDRSDVYIFTRENDKWRENGRIEGDLLPSLAVSEKGDVLAVKAGFSLSREWESICFTAEHECIMPPQVVDGRILKCPLKTKCAEAAVKQPYYMSDIHGGVYIFSKGEHGWRHEAYVKSVSPGEKDRFGEVLAMSADGSVVAVGVPEDDSGAAGIDANAGDGTAYETGAVYLYARSGGEWRRQAFIKASNPDVNDRFGSSVALSADGLTLAVGAPFESGGATGINGTQSDNSAFEAGAVYVYVYENDDWRQQAYVKSADALVVRNQLQSRENRFGSAVALSSDGNLLIVGAPLEASETIGINGESEESIDTPAAGAVYTFIREGIDWRQQAYVKAANTQKWDSFGSSVSLSGDGGTLAVGATGEGSTAVGICVTGSAACAAAQAENPADKGGKGKAWRMGAVYLY